MIESGNPEIDVNELLKRVRAEAERLRALAPRQQNGSDVAVGIRLPETQPLRAFPRMVTALQTDARADRLSSLHDLLERARQATEVSKRIPKPFRQLFRKQGRYNSLLIQSAIALFETVNKLVQWQNGWSADFNAQNRWLADLSSSRYEEAAWMKAAERIINSLGKAQERLDQQLQAGMAHNTALQQNLASLEQRHTSDVAFIKAELSRQAALIDRWPDGRPRAGARTARQPQAESGPCDRDKHRHRLDAFYFSFENRFRGPREEIKERVRFYLPFLQRVAAGTQTRPVVDVGCGRGEWLELLREQNLMAWGVDLNEVMVAQCKERQLNVVQADAIEFLRSLPDRSQGAVTGFHIIEHLPFETLMALFGEALRVLQPGGIAIFESPNCKNLMVGACNFNIDPTHRNPVFPETAQFMLESHGFERVTLEYLAPVDATDFSGLGEQPAYIRELLYGPQDFAVTGYKSGAE